MLGDLFNKYGSDKDRNGYSPYYDPIFKNIRQNPIAMLEIGIGTMIPGVSSSMVGYSLPGYSPGGSLRAWRDYFPNGHITGCDVQPDTQFVEDRITTCLADSSSKQQLDAVLNDKMFDIILDDGCHYDETQVTTLRNLFHRVKPGGFYIIEDIQPWSRIGTEFRDDIQKFVGPTTYIYMFEKRNVMILSKA
jgi:hypothetical protein